MAGTDFGGRGKRALITSIPRASGADLISYVRRMAQPATTWELCDRELLGRFLASRDEAAFAALVHRHGPMVLGVCRRALRCHQDAEDALQATFVVLVRKAATIRHTESLAGWLYGVARRTAARARVVAARRQARERALTDYCSEDRAPLFASELRLILDEELARLPAKYRTPVLLCYLQGLTNDEAARQLGCPKGTVQSRLAVARARLRARLTRRGLGWSGDEPPVFLCPAVLSIPLAQELLAKTIRAAIADLGSTAGTRTILPTSVAALARAVLRSMVAAKVRIMAAVLIVGAALGGAGLWLQHDAVAEEKRVDKPQTISTTSEAEPGLRRGSSEMPDAVSRSFQTGPAPRVIVQLAGGAVDVRARPGDMVNARVTREGIPVRFGHKQSADLIRDSIENMHVSFEQDGNTVQVKARGMRADPRLECITAATVEVPEAALVEIRTSNGRVSLEGGSGKTILHTSNGAIRVRRAVGELDLETSNAEIDIRAQQALVTAHTSEGSIFFEGSLAPGKSSLRARNGNVRLVLPPETAFRIDAQTVSGSISDQFHIRPEAGSSRSRLIGAVGSHAAVDLRLRTSNGSIALIADASFLR